MNRLEERVAIVVTEHPSFSGTMLERVSAVIGAMEALQRGGFHALLDDFPPGKCCISARDIRDHLNQDSPKPHSVGWIWQLADGRVRVQ